MAAEAILLRTTAFLARTSWRKEFCDGLRDSTLRLGRSRWTTGESVGAQADCEKGALIADATKRILCFARLDGSATSDAATRRALMTPLRASWHYDDASGTPTIDNRVVQGDSLVYDSGSGDRYLMHYDSVAGSFKGLGVFAEYRTAATSTDASTRNQSSERLTMRASKWDTSGTPAAKYRDWSLSVFTSELGANSYSGLKFTRQNQGGSSTDVATMDSNGYLYIAGAVPGFEVNSTGAGVAYLKISGADADGTVLRFLHGDTSRWARFRLFGTVSGGDGIAADVLSVSFGGDATALITTRNSPSIVHWAAAWDGAKSVSLAHYTQLVPTSDTVAYLEHGFDFSGGVFRLHQDGLLEALGSSTGGVRLGQYTTASVSNPMVDSSQLTFRGSYHDGTAHDADFYAQHYIDTADPTGRLRISSSYGVGLWDFADDGRLILQSTTPASDDPSNPQKIIDSTKLILRGHSWDGAASADRDFTLRCFVGSSADEGDVWALLYDNGTADCGGVMMDGTRAVGDAAANVLSFTLDAGTHPAVNSGTTKTTPGTVDGWMVIDVNGTPYYSPLYTSKTT